MFICSGYCPLKALAMAKEKLRSFDINWLRKVGFSSERTLLKLVKSPLNLKEPVFLGRKPGLLDRFFPILSLGIVYMMFLCLWLMTGDFCYVDLIIILAVFSLIWWGETMSRTAIIITPPSLGVSPINNVSELWIIPSLKLSIRTIDFGVSDWDSLASQ